MRALDVPADITAVQDRLWTRLAHAGTWFTGAERVAIASAARGDATTDDAPSAPAPALVAARTIHDEPASIRQDWIDELQSDGLTLAEYVEVLGVVAQLRALDTVTFGLGRGIRPLPAPVDGEPSRTVVAEAAFDGGWVPTVGAASPPTVLSSVPAENAGMHELHAALYLAADGANEGNSMGNWQVVRDGLTRSQLEFVAARTSLLNDCFF